MAADGGFDEVAAMLTRMGGFVDPRVRVGIMPSGVRGLLVTADIPAKTVLIHVPAGAVLAPIDREAKEVDSCAQVETVHAELRKGEQSAWWPYLRFDDSLGSKVLDTWSREELEELQGLPPDDAGRHVEWYMKRCRPELGSYAELSAQEQQAIWILVRCACARRALRLSLSIAHTPHTHANTRRVYRCCCCRHLPRPLCLSPSQSTRGADIGLLPIYDLMNHNNGELNTYMGHTETSGVNVVTRHDIEKGSELFNSYGHQ